MDKLEKEMVSTLNILIKSKNKFGRSKGTEDV